MLKNILISVLAAVVVLAIGVGVFNLVAGSENQSALAAAGQNNLTPVPAVSQGLGSGSGWGDTSPNAIGPNTAQGQGRGRQGNGRQGRGSQGNGRNGGQSGEPNPQSGFTGWTTYQGVVSSFAAPNLTIVTAEGQSLTVQLGNQNFAANMGLTLQSGDQVTLTGFQDPGGSIAVGSLTLDATGQTFTFRTNNGRPAWAGGGRNP